MKVFAWIAILVWAAFLYGGVKFSTRSALLCYTPVVFPQNHMVTAGDLRCASSAVTKIYEGRYLKHPSTKNGSISPDDVDVTPVLRIGPDATVFVLTVSGDWARKLDADQEVDLGTDSTTLVKQTRVIALLSSGIGSEPSRVALEIPQSKLKMLVDAPGQLTIFESSKVVTPPTGSSAQTKGKKE